MIRLEEGLSEASPDTVRGQNTGLLFREGKWEIHGNPLQHPRLNPANSRVVHYCENPLRYERDCDSTPGFCHVWSKLARNRTCPKCQEVMPDSVQTLWTLQNFDVEFGDHPWHNSPQPHEVTR